MKRNSAVKRFTLSFAIILIAFFALTFGLSISDIANASDGNVVYFNDLVYHSTSSGIVYAELVAEGHPNEVVKVSYRTQSETAIQGVDFNGVANTVSITIGASGTTKYKIAIKCLNDSTTRQKLYIVANNENYGRFFNIKIDSAENAEVNTSRDTCKCYLSFNSSVDATVGQLVTTIGGTQEVAYCNAYKTMQSKYYNKKTLDGRKTFKSWQYGMSYVNAETTNWLNAYINQGLADAYSSYLIKWIDNDQWHSSTDIYVLAGDNEFIQSYEEVSRTVPGMYLYLGFEPHRSGAGLFGNACMINGRAMYLISVGKNPYDEEDDWVDVNSRVVCSPTKRVYWIQDGETWYADDNAITDSVFYKIYPYAGVLDSAVIVWNKNKEVDIRFEQLYTFMTLIDDKAPEIVGEYIDDSRLLTDGILRFNIRFNEPVYLSKTNSLLQRQALQFNVNHTNQPYYADYVEGNYTDTLVYEISASNLPKRNITNVTYYVPEDASDMSYYLDQYKNVLNNKVVVQKDGEGHAIPRTFNFLNGTINYYKPDLSMDKTHSNEEKNIYNLMLSLNANEIAEGTIYYEWSTSDSKTDSQNPSVYQNSYVLTNEDSGSMAITLYKDEAAGFTSGTYYFHALAISPYGLKDYHCFGPYKLDGEPPQVVLSTTTNEFKNKVFELNNSKTTGAQPYNITFVAEWSDENGSNKQSINLMTNGTRISAFTQPSDYRYQYSTNIETDGDFIREIMGTNNRIDAKVYLNVEDSAGNKATTNSLRAVYDRRDVFGVNTTFPSEQGYIQIDDIPTLNNAYDISNVQRDEGKGIVFSVNSADRSQVVSGETAFSITINGEKVYASSTDEYTVVIGDLEPGFYEAIPTIKGELSGQVVDLVSYPIYFYLSNGKNDVSTNKTNAENGLVLTNKVFQIEDARFYYLDEAGSNVSSHLYGATLNELFNNYEGGSTTPTFSNSIEAKKYIKYMEYQDLYIVKLTANMASLLNSNSGSTAYMKAQGETVVAQEGQLWIRYKRDTWTTTANPYGWAFYYYNTSSSSMDININGLSQNLNNAINTVVNRIVAAGKTVNLVQDWQIDQASGAPYLAVSQVHSAREEITQTKTGTSYIVNPTYDGDANIYLNTVTVNDVDYPLATNLKFVRGDNSEIYYKYGESTEWIQLNINDGQVLRDVLGVYASGIYTIREYGDFGVCEYQIYYDKQLPLLDILINDIPQTLDGTIMSLSGVKASLTEMRNAADSLAYVAVYTYPNRVLLDVLYKDDIPGYTLSSGNYYLQVGDRAGNIATYSLLLSTAQLDVTAVESESGTSVIVKVSNRNDNEIYSYEVYLNEELIDTEYAATKSYKSPGIYRIVVMDIYGNSKTVSIDHDYQTPKITWYYLNSMDSYSEYNPDHIVRMVMVNDSSSARTTNVFTSTYLRLKFDLNYGDSEIKYEMLDIDASMYSYSPITGVLSINALTGWRMRVWFEDHPENDHIYSCQLDTEAPGFDGSFVGTSFSNPYGVETLTQEQFAAIGVGNMIIPEGLTYITFGTGTLSFGNGDIIDGNHISIKLNDSSGIKSYSVTRNGLPLEMELDANDTLLINSYGSYVITATDNLGNTSVFSFTNTKDPIATAKAGNEVLKDSETFIGHDDVIITTNYVAYTQFLFHTEDRDYPFIFQFDGSTLTYGNYFVSEIVNEEDPSIKIYEADYVTASGFMLSLSDPNVKLERWYTVYENDLFIIYAMFDAQSKLAFKVQSISGAISFTVDSSVGSGKIPSEFNAVLSQEKTDIPIYSDGQRAEIIEGLDFIYIAGTITLKIDDVHQYMPTIERIEYAYSKDSAEFSNFTTIYWQDSEHDIKQEIDGTANGYYQIIVYNEYKNETVYTIRKVASFQSIVTARYQDGSERVYYEDHDRWIYSNSEISLLVFSTNVSFIVNDETYEGIVSKSTTELVLNTYGTFDVRVISANGIFENFKFELGMEGNFELDEEWITGYNMDALLHEQGYTNTRLSISEESLDAGVMYIDFVYNGSLIVTVYDELAEKPITDLNNLNECIGKNGAGTYLVRFRDKYGDAVEKMIHYNNTPNFNISRMILGDDEWETIENPTTFLSGIRSNYKVKFETTSSIYEFKINGNITSLDEPKILEYGTSGNGSFEYLITFIDEYGNKMSSTVYFARKEIEIDKSSMKEVTIDDVLYTRSNIVITFENQYYSYVKVNNGEYVAYKSGTTFFKDGKYEFLFEDIYGNRLNYTINHKSYTQYTLTNRSTETEIIQGSVINNAQVVFKSLDGSYIKTVVKNGNSLSDYSGNAFADTGHWELLIEDNVGNQSYAEFWIISNSLGELTYIPPYGYQISEIWLTDSQGESKSQPVDKEKLYLNKNGDYIVLVTGTEISQSFRFTITIDNTPPSITLDGVENGGTTPRDVTIKGLKVGDVVKIYKDGVLEETIEVTVSTQVPTISSGGDYKIVVTNMQGISSEYTFTRKKIANTATSIFFIVLAVAIMIGIAIGLFYHTRHKTDA